MQSTHKPIRIAFGHKARVGKDTAVEYIGRGYGCEVVRFAEPVYAIATAVQTAFVETKNMVDLCDRVFLDIAIHTEWASVHKRETRRAVVNWIAVKLFPRILKERGPGAKGTKVPWLLQMIGTDLREIIGVDVWVNIVRDKMMDILDANPHANICCPDMRFQNEFKMLREMGFTLVNITRKSRIIDRDPNHPSEIALDGAVYDYMIENDSTIQDYQATLDVIIQTKFNDLDVV